MVSVPLKKKNGDCKMVQMVWNTEMVTTLHPKDDMKLLLNPILSISHTNNKNNNIPSCNNKSSCKWSLSLYLYLYIVTLDYPIGKHVKKRHLFTAPKPSAHPTTEPLPSGSLAMWKQGAPCRKDAKTAGRKALPHRRPETTRPWRLHGRENTHVKTHPWAQGCYSTGSLFNHK